MSEAPNLEPIQALNEALAKAQGAFPAIERSREVTVKTRQGGTYSFSYAPLDAILQKVRPALTENGLALTQLLEDAGRGPALRTELRHSGGGVVTASFPLPGVPENAQQLGSLLTYLRRYAIVALLGIASEEDDDANAAAGNEIEPKLSKGTREQIFDELTLLADHYPPPGDADNWTDAARRVAMATWGVDGIGQLSEPQGKELLTRLRAKKRELEQQAQAQEAEQMAWETSEVDEGDFRAPSGKRGEGA